MQKFFITILVFLANSILIFATTVEKLNIQFTNNDTTTKIERLGLLGVNFNSVGLKNWAGGGNNSISTSAKFGLGYNYITFNTVWNNSLEGGYGVVKLGDEGFKKTDDRIILSSKFGYKAANELSYSALLDFRTQFANGYDYNKLDSQNNYLIISKFMAPAYLTIGLGMNYKPLQIIDIYLSPLSNRIIFVLDEDLANNGAYGVTPGKKLKSELGSTFDMIIQSPIITNVDLRTRLNLFSAYENFTSVVINWEFGLNFKVNEYITAAFSLNSIYDEKININRDDGTYGPATQLKHVLLIGFAYKFNY